MKKLQLAEIIARGAHAGQKYGGYDYSYHLEAAVAQGRALFPESPKLDLILQALWLHDVVEDTDMTTTELEDLGFDPQVVDAVKRVSKVESQDMQSYYEGIAKHKLAFKVKVADTMANLAQSTKERQSKRIRKYSQQLTVLHDLRDAYSAKK